MEEDVVEDDSPARPAPASSSSTAAAPSAGSGGGGGGGASHEHEPASPKMPVGGADDEDEMARSIGGHSDNGDTLF